MSPLKARLSRPGGALLFPLGAPAPPPAAATSDFLADVLTERGSSGTGMVSRFEQSPYRGGGARIDLLPPYLYEGEHLYPPSYPAGPKSDFWSDQRAAAFLSPRFGKFSVDRVAASLPRKSPPRS